MPDIKLSSENVGRSMKSADFLAVSISKVDRKMKIKSFLVFVATAVLFALTSCGSSTAPTTYTIGGQVLNLSGTGLVLENNGGNNLAIASNGPFTFTTAIVSGASYNVTVLTQPSSPAQTCVVTNPTGTATSSVSSVEVECTNNTFTVGGKVSGLSGAGLVLQDNGGDNLPISGNGNYSFATPISKGGNYSVTVLTQPSSPAQICDVTNAIGSNVLGNVTYVFVTCYTTTVSYSIGGTVSGLSGTGLVLQDNGGDYLPISANGSFKFPTPVASGAPFSVTVLTQPSNPSQTCTVTGGGGTASGNITGILVNCTNSISGTISRLSGAGLVLQDNGGNNLQVSEGASSFKFATQVASGSSYAVTVLTQPSGQSCAVTNGSGMMPASSVTNVTINCSGNIFNVGATVSGLLPNTSVTLQDNGGDNLIVSTNNLAANFNAPVAGDSQYAVTVLTQPAGATCSVGTNASGMVTTADVNIAVTCGTIIAEGQAHACAVDGAGRVSCWGSNEYGQLGNGNTTDSVNPVLVSELPDEVVSIAVGGEFSCALTKAGSVWCWGNNATGQLGDGTFTQSSVPVEVLDSTGRVPLGGVVAIAAGQTHACAVTGSAAAVCWGDNTSGELGNAIETGTNIPVPVSGLSSGVATISAGSYFTCAVTTSTAALCWGKGSSGQLGSGSFSWSATPAAVLDSSGNAPLSGVVAISAGYENACALTSVGTLVCWGANNSSQLGNDTTGSESNLPVRIIDSTGQSPLSGIVAVSSGLDDNCALTRAGAALCWGLNEDGQLGNGNTIDSVTPAPVSGLSSGVAAIAAGDLHTCAITGGGSALCWGSRIDGQLDNGSTSKAARVGTTDFQ